MLWHTMPDRPGGGYWRCYRRWQESQARADARRAYHKAIYDMRRRARSRLALLTEGDNGT